MPKATTSSSRRPRPKAPPRRANESASTRATRRAKRGEPLEAQTAQQRSPKQENL